MKKTNTIQVSSQEAQNYCKLLEKVQADIETLVYEIEAETTNNTTEVSRDITFDVVPILRRLRDAYAETQTSLAIFGKIKKKKS